MQNKPTTTLNTTPFSLPLFPLSAHILPGGRLALRIFEPRYVRMVKEACANNTGFGICMLSSQGDKTDNHHILPIGTYVTVEDFDLLEDGLLGVTVAGHRCFTVGEIQTESDQLRVGQCNWVENWQLGNESLNIAPIDERLKDVFEKYPEVAQLYQTPRFDDPVWVIYRWLELIPVNAQTKQGFLQQKDYGKALNYLSQLVE